MHIFAKSIVVILITLLALLHLYGNVIYSREAPSPTEKDKEDEEEENKNQNLFDPSAFSGSFNNGQYEYIKDGVRIFAKGARDPGVYFETITRKIGGYKYLVFDIKGELERLGQWCFPVVQIYDINDDDYTPSITKTSFTFSGKEYATIVVPLEGKIKTVSKIQFMLVTDRGSWDVYIKNAHFE